MKTEIICWLEFQAIPCEFNPNQLFTELEDACDITLSGNDDFGYYCSSDYCNGIISEGKTKEKAVRKMLDKIEEFCGNQNYGLQGRIDQNLNIIERVRFTR
jgi:hypothetical protein